MWSKSSLYYYFCLFLLLLWSPISIESQVYYPASRPAEQMPDEKTAYYAIKDGAALYATNKDSAMSQILKGIEASEHLQFGEGVFTGYFLLGVLYIYQGDYETASTWLERAIQQASSSRKMATNLCRALNNLGNVQHFQGNYQKAAEYYFHAIDIAETALNKDKDTGVINPLIRIYTSTANALLQLNELDKSTTFLNKAEILTKKMGYTPNLPDIYINRAIISKRKENFQEAWKYTQQALAIAREFKLDEPQHMAYQQLGDLLITTGKHREAINYLKKTLLIKGYVNPYYEIQTLLLLGTSNLYLKHFDQSEAALIQAFQKAEKLGTPTQLLGIHKELANLYSQTNKYQKAFYHQFNAYQLNDSLLNNEKTKAVNLLEIKYRTAEKEKELTQKQLLINNQQSRLERKNLWITGISTSTLLLATILGLVYSLYHSNKQKHRLQNEKIRTLQQQKEIDLLKALMTGEEQERVRIAQDLHDGIVVQFTAAKMNFRAHSTQFVGDDQSEEFNKAMQQLDEAIKDLRQTAHNLLPDILLEEGLAEAVYYFCKNLKLPPGLEIDFQLYGQIPLLTPDFELSIYRIVQELIHNVIKHSKATHAIIQLTYQDQHLSLTVEDNGVGIPPQLLQNKKGIGLRNIRTRVRAIGGEIDIRTETGKGTIVYIEFDLHTIFNKNFALT